MRIANIADLHGAIVPVPDADVLIVAGDVSHDMTDLIGFEYLIESYGRLPHRFKIMVAGNHDVILARLRREALDILCDNDFIYLEDDEVIINGVRIYGAPWTPVFGSYPFMLSAQKLKNKWAMIPDGIDILVTHGAPYGILDRNKDGFHIGDCDLGKRVRKIQPALHIFGHCHEGYGMVRDNGEGRMRQTTYVNVATFKDVLNNVDRPPVILEYDHLTGEVR